MSSGSNQQGSRRDFLQSAARYGGLVTLTAACAWLARPRDGQTCVNNSICSGCSAFTDCGLPAALSARTRTVVPISQPARPVGAETRGPADSEIGGAGKEPHHE